VVRDFDAMTTRSWRESMRRLRGKKLEPITVISGSSGRQQGSRAWVRALWRSPW